ncbi:MAG: Glu/Leu/Phe/Val dehydrogenase [Planctomycetes bacterium]|nr:Glu/Leu/Phe/Val dehydrogenase [Planctomycetota bacterium]
MKISELKIDDYEKVIHGVDEQTGLNAFIGVHCTTLGPALGGLRIWPYEREEDALTDVLRLSKGMTYKSAIARTGLGGGKSVVIGDPKVVRNPDTMRAMGRLIDSLGGLYITAEDVNTRIEDLEHVREETRWVTGLSLERGGSGNPSPYTGRGVYLGIKACFEEVYGSGDPAGRHIAIQGAGSVAQTVIDLLLADGARVTACDINPERIAQVKAKHPEVVFVDSKEIYDVDCDVFSPHALGAVVNDQTIDRLRCRIVAGAANNQLAELHHDDLLKERGILYAPDFVINAGGIINVSVEFHPGGYDEKVALEKIGHIDDALKSTFAKARAENVGTGRAAIDVAKQIIAEAKAK